LWHWWRFCDDEVFEKSSLRDKHHRPADLQQHFGWPDIGRAAGDVGSGARTARVDPLEALRDE